MAALTEYALFKSCCDKLLLTDLNLQFVKDPFANKHTDLEGVQDESLKRKCLQLY